MVAIARTFYVEAIAFPAGFGLHQGSTMVLINPYYVAIFGGLGVFLVSACYHLSPIVCTVTF